MSVLAVFLIATAATADAGSLAAVRRMGLTQADAAKMEALTKQSPEDCIALGRAACVATLDGVIAAHRSSSSAKAVACESRRKEVGAQAAFLEEVHDCERARDESMRLKVAQEVRDFNNWGKSRHMRPPRSPPVVPPRPPAGQTPSKERSVCVLVCGVGF